ncbi:hypothetical protein A3C87_03030 [Candidatus Kaiserbacteria bacterium RIFCSPHIGHO2_02_FULL_49_34]|uniref:DUF4760 domain-containing protein n=1 Tax=Candidatus Kaiserbacteria bacterium RIFCSPHIGHO2_02_FULL_49_34 TaxID=1798491 RepID=A0A1F6DI19_9BACT|nr:MAG: hypothetical protein A3C87_03030 [Candidatus Kaiserbacteria bacterium RIFCSPHIGHO2_02_FULL_49_34]
MYIILAILVGSIGSVITFYYIWHRSRARRHATLCGILREEIRELRGGRFLNTQLDTELHHLSQRLKLYMHSVYRGGATVDMLDDVGEQLIRDARRLRDCARNDIARRRTASSIYERAFPAVYQLLRERLRQNDKAVMKIWQRMVQASLDTKGPGVFRAVRLIQKLQKEYGEPVEQNNNTAYKPHPTDFASRYS